MTLNLAMYNDEFLVDANDDFIDADTDFDPDCCCPDGETECADLNCICTGTIINPNDCGYGPFSWRIGASASPDNFRCAGEPVCANLFHDSVVAAGGDVGGAGIEMVQQNETDCCNWLASTTLTCCDCDIPSATPGGGGVMTLECVDVNGTCFVRATVTLCGGTIYQLDGFDVNADSASPNILTLVDGGSASSCCDIPDEIEVFGP